MINKIIEKIVDDLPEEMKLAMLAGCELEHNVVVDSIKGTKYKIKTKYPIRIKENNNNKFLFELINGREILKAMISPEGTYQDHGNFIDD